MKTAFLVDGNPNNPGAYNQIINSVKSIGNHLDIDKQDIVFIASNEHIVQKLTEFGFNSIIYKKNFFDKLCDYIFDFNFFYKSFIKLNLKHSFSKFLTKKKIDLIIFLSPSELALFCDEINFVINIWDLDHKKNSIYPEHKKNFTYEKREEFLNNILFKAYRVIVAHQKNKNDLIDFYKCEKEKIIIQDFIPDLPNIKSEELEFFNNQEKEYIENFPLNKKVIIYPATFWPHKNHKYIIDAAILLKKEKNFNYHFVMCGSDRGTFSYIKQMINENNINENVKIFPLVSNLFLKKLYEKCFAVIMPTDAGPTNLPLYESMYFKKPIFYSKNMSIDKEINQIIFPINTDEPNEFLNMLKNLKQEDIAKKTKLGHEYYIKNCNKENFYNMYRNIIINFKKKITQWKKL